MPYNEDDECDCTDCRIDRGEACSSCREDNDDCTCDYSDDDDNEEASGVIRQYNYDVTRALPSDIGSRLFGVELEVATPSSRNAAAEWVDSKFGKDVIVKHDGSLNYGIEIVTRPMTLENQTKFWTRFLTDPDIPKHLGTDTSCGIHVHVTKQSIHRAALEKAVTFMNMEEHRGAIEIVAGRKGNTYCNYFKGKVSPVVKKQRDEVMNWNNGSKYVPLNTSKGATVEFRIFASTLDPDIFLKNLQFVDSILAFVAITSLKELKWVNYAKFVHNNQDRFPHLWKFGGGKVYIRVVEKEVKVVNVSS